MFVVERGSDGESVVTWRTYFNGKGLAAPLIAFMMKRMIFRKNLKRLIRQYGGRIL